MPSTGMGSENDTIYDRYGKPILRLLDDGRFVDFGGQNIGYLDGQDIYNYQGKHIGWYDKGIIRDHIGNCAGFGEEITATMAPFPPFKQIKPIPAITRIEPIRPIPQIPPIRPYDTFMWSDKELIPLFLE